MRGAESLNQPALCLMRPGSACGVIALIGLMRRSGIEALAIRSGLLAGSAPHRAAPDARSRARGDGVLDQGRRRDPNRLAESRADRSRQRTAISVDGATGGLVDRRRVSVQWFSGTILTGLCGAALMGGAVFSRSTARPISPPLPERIERRCAARSASASASAARTRPIGCRRPARRTRRAR